ncbi:hypothetical protein PIB30_071558 [Stylosanthes scabra]|uniref:Uncharacterized protein n=1 Tax=Stylosanthes scabra TaxID=79078 RepID=A0ABU6QNE3_9FABA|nr:hypothetical protein [Stylosanthes scabra]
MGAHRTPVEKLEERVHETRNEIIEMRKQIREWTRNASSREAYCCWAHQHANSNLVEILAHKIPDFLHGNVANKKHAFYGALKSESQQGESSQEKCKRKLGKQENRGNRESRANREQDRALTHRRHNPHLGVA